MARKRLKTDQDVQAHSALSGFLPPVREWFEQRFGVASPPQRLGWPSIAAGQNTLIVAPTGSGKTLASFLAALNWLWQQPDHGQSKGVRLLYLSPLKALNVDIARNLEGPLAEILQQAERTGFPLRPLQVGVRTGDTPAADRQRMVRRPPDILITTPESLHLLLTGRSRQMLTGVSHVIIDEIHAVCGNKRGVFLSLLLERLAAHSNTEFVRIGLSATQRPLEEVARYLGGRKKVSGRGGSAIFEPRPVTIIDAGQRKDLDILVSQPAGRMRPGESVWPAIEERLLELIGQHQSTIVFANNRRVVERLAAGPAAFDSFIAALHGPWSFLGLFTVLIFAVHNATSWFNVTPKAMPVQIGEEFLPGKYIVAAHYAVWVIASLAVLFFAGVL